MEPCWQLSPHFGVLAYSGDNTFGRKRGFQILLQKRIIEQVSISGWTSTEFSVLFLISNLQFLFLIFNIQQTKRKLKRKMFSWWSPFNCFWIKNGITQDYCKRVSDGRRGHGGLKGHVSMLCLPLNTLPANQMCTSRLVPLMNNFAFFLIIICCPAVSWCFIQLFHFFFFN